MTGKRQPDGLVQWLITVAVVTAVLLVASIADAGWIYDVDGIMTPTLVNPVSTSFTGTITFDEQTTDTGSLRITLTNEFDPDSGDPIYRDAPFSMVSNVTEPIGVRSFAGTWDEQPFTMNWFDWDSDVASEFASFDLTDGAGWDSWQIGFHDYQLGSMTAVRSPVFVNEPAGAALLVIGVVVAIGVLRERT